MEPKHGIVRLDAAAEWLSKTTGRTFTADDLIDAHDRLPVYAVIPESKCNPGHSEPVLREFREKAIEVERLTKSHPRSLGGLAAADAGVPRGLFTPEAIAEVAVRRMRPDIALLHKWEQAAKKQSVYLLSDEDVSILAANGEVRLGRAVSIFNRWIGRPIQFGNPVDVTSDMLAVRRSQLVKFAEIVAVEQPEARPDAETSQDSPEGGTSGLVAWQAIAIESWPEISKAYKGAPTAINVVAWLKKHGPRDVFPDEQPDRYTLRWIDRERNIQTVAQKTVANMVSAWRKAGKIPA